MDQTLKINTFFGYKSKFKENTISEKYSYIASENRIGDGDLQNYNAKTFPAAILPLGYQS